MSLIKISLCLCACVCLPLNINVHLHKHSFESIISSENLDSIGFAGISALFWFTFEHSIAIYSHLFVPFTVDRARKYKKGNENENRNAKKLSINLLEPSKINPLYFRQCVERMLLMKLLRRNFHLIEDFQFGFLLFSTVERRKCSNKYGLKTLILFEIINEKILCRCAQLQTIH